MPTSDMPPEIAEYVGEDQFGPAYQVMLAGDAHAPGSVDRVLSQRMIRLHAATADYLYGSYTPTTSRYRPGSRPELERFLRAATDGATDPEAIVDGIVRWCADIAEAADELNLDDLRLGGHEEAIVERGTDWCTDLSRVGCVLCQVAGLPARLVCLFNTSAAYSGHVIVEVLRHGRWGCVDVVNGVVYRHQDGAPASAWELQHDAPLIAAHRRLHGGYGSPAQFLGVAIVNYFVWEADRYNFTVSGLNPYTRSILEQSMRGWPGGLR
ncbi:MAG: hypothetical protein OXF61_15955, partial [Acidimicrobiaceae bacterium]|nr:hypothetical protein [Acidimicrobiaceae bacterium]